jgi:1-deoxy-D-xylulose-5-phosphate reductoisomerase
MNAANEVANAAFRKGLCRFTDIDAIVEKVMEATDVEPVASIEQLAEVDRLARARAERASEGIRL